MASPSETDEEVGMGYPRTNAEIVNDALFRAGELTDGSSDYEAKALDYLNRVYLAIAAGGSELNKDVNEKWWWLRSSFPGVITLLPVETGDVQVEFGSVDIEFNLAPDISLQGRLFRTDGTQDVFRIASHNALDTVAALDSIYTGPDNLAENYEASQMEYTIPSNVMEILSPMRAYQQSRAEIIGMDPQSLAERWPFIQKWQGVPMGFAQIGNNKVRFSHEGGSNPDELIRVDFDYLIRPDSLAKDANECLMPEEYRKTLSDFTCMFILVDKDDTKAQDVGSMARAGLIGMATENRRRLNQVSKNMGQLMTRPGQSRDRYPLRTTGGRIIR